MNAPNLYGDHHLCTACEELLHAHKMKIAAGKDAVGKDADGKDAGEDREHLIRLLCADFIEAHRTEEKSVAEKETKSKN